MIDDFLIYYCLFGFFLFYIKKWMKDFKGASEKVYLFLIYYSGLGTVFGISIVIYAGYLNNWLYALKVFVVGILSTMLLVTIETIVTSKLLKIDYAVEKIGLVSLFLVPILAIQMLIQLKVF